MIHPMFGLYLVADGRKLQGVPSIIFNCLLVEEVHTVFPTLGPTLATTTNVMTIKTGEKSLKVPKRKKGDIYSRGDSCHLTCLLPGLMMVTYMGLQKK